jgi:thymidine phosphorylase
MTPAPDVVDLIRTKRDGGRLDSAQISFLVDGYARDLIPDEQVASFLMAVYWRGLDPAELRDLTAAIIASGERLDLSDLPRPTVDKHSTGGVGDKVSLILAPLVASFGAAVPQLSGRGLGHTGGTLDKLESIKGFEAALSNDRIKAILADYGCVICAAGAGLAPADRKLYALRDVTGTVESIPLIASSIMSKKIAEGTAALVLDVKVGTGAFMTDEGRARLLAETMVQLGAEHGVRTSALLTRMDEPLGRAVGNALEVEESIATLSGSGPDDLVEVTVALAAEMLSLAGITDTATGTDQARNALAEGTALSTFSRMIEAQGGTTEWEPPRAGTIEIVPAPSTGYLRRLDALGVGVAAWRLGAGRAKKTDSVSPTAGVVCLAKPGDEVTAGEPLLELHTDEPARLEAAREALSDAIDVGPEPPDRPSLVIDVIRS